MHHGADAIIVGREFVLELHSPNRSILIRSSAKGLQESADRLSRTSGRKCIAAPADVRDPEQIKKAIEVAEKIFLRIDFVICGAAKLPSLAMLG